MDFGSLWDKLVGTPVPSMLVIVGLALVALALLGKLKDWFQLENIGEPQPWRLALSCSWLESTFNESLRGWHYKKNSLGNPAHISRHGKKKI